MAREFPVSREIPGNSRTGNSREGNFPGLTGGREREFPVEHHCYDAHYHQLEFEVGQKVLLATKNLKLPGSRKLYPRLVGPFKVLQRVGAAAYKLDLAGRLSQLERFV